jgi:signal transduction histidine kinase
VDLAEVVSKAEAATSSQSQFKNIRVLNEVPADAHCVNCDPNMIQTVLRNLISNAIKFSQQGSTVRILSEQKNDRVVVLVSDEGEGIDEENLESIISFGNDKQKKGTRGEKGIGMGLMLCKEFVEKHDGDIWFESNAGQGSTFSFSLPLS